MRITQDLQYKAECYYGKGCRNSMLKMLLVDGTSAMILYRLSQCCREKGLGLFSFLLRWFNRALNGCWIGRNAEFGAGFVIMHPVGIVINSGVRGGKNIVLQSGVVIGTARSGPGEKPPVLGSSLVVGAGGKILGNIRIGSHVTIGANSVVVKDVPDNVTVGGVPARILTKNKHRRYSSPQLKACCAAAEVENAKR